MLSKTFFFMTLFSFVCAVFSGRVEVMSAEVAKSFYNTVELCLSLLGMMSFWSGLMNVFKKAGVLNVISKLIKPLMKIIYGKDAAKGENLENLSASFSANLLGLGNAALPLGINVIKGFEKDNKRNSASDSAVMFAVLSTVPFQLLPSTLIAQRSSYGSENPFDVIPYIWFCSVVIIIFAVVVTKILSKLWRK